MEGALGRLAMTWHTTGKLESRSVARLGRPDFPRLHPSEKRRPIGVFINSELLCQDHALLVSLPI